MSQKKSKISMKAQLTLKISLAVACLWVVLIMLIFWWTRQEFYDDLNNLAQRQSQNLNFFLESKSTELSAKALSISNLIFTDRTITDPSTDVIKQRLGNIWESLKRDDDKLEILYLDKNKKLLSAYGLFTSGVEKFSNAELRSKQELVHGNVTSAYITCPIVCYLNIIKQVSPYTIQSKSGYLNLRYPLYDIAFQLKRIDQSESIILTKQSEKYTKSIRIKQESWYISDSTNYSLFNALIKPLNTLEEKPDVSINEEHYTAVDFKFKKPIELLTEAKIMIITNTTEIRNRFLNKMLVVMLASLLMIFLMLFLIYQFMRQPMHLMRQLSHAVSILGKGEFQLARTRLEQIPEQQMASELHLIRDTTHHVSQELEELHNKIQDSFEERLQELDFINKLVNTSNIIFITHDQHHQITLCNQYAADWLGYTVHHVTGKDFRTFFSMDTFSTSPHKSSKDYETFESYYAPRQQEKRLISWSRSIFTPKSGQNQQIIYVGMDITHRLELEDKIRYVADHDALTGLVNRRRFDMTINEYILRKEVFFLLYIDLNYFKLVNDTLGHAIGDKLLTRVGQILKESTSPESIVARTGGDEFSILMPGSEIACATAYCNQVIQKTRLVSDIIKDNQLRSTNVGLSIGVVHFPDQAKTQEELYAKADAAMYENKINRVGSYHFYTGNEFLINEMHITKYWHDAIRKSIDNNLIYPFFQSIHAVKNPETICFHEVLCRVVIDGKLTSATQFINKITNNQLLIEIDLLMIDTALSMFKLKKNTPTLLFNLSTHTISKAFAAEDILACIQKNDFPPYHVVFEITEQIAITDMKKTLAFMSHLKSHGIRFALDDFGTGYSSLSYLRRIPVEYLKLDKSFTQNDLNDAKNIRFIENIIAMVKSLGIEVIIEGVESPELFERVRHMNIDYLQGYYFSRPAHVLTETIVANPHQNPTFPPTEAAITPTEQTHLPS